MTVDGQHRNLRAGQERPTTLEGLQRKGHEQGEKDLAEIERRAGAGAGTRMDRILLSTFHFLVSSIPAYPLREACGPGYPSLSAGWKPPSRLPDDLESLLDARAPIEGVSPEMPVPCILETLQRTPFSPGTVEMIQDLFVAKVDPSAELSVFGLLLRHAQEATKNPEGLHKGTVEEHKGCLMILDQHQVLSRDITANLLSFANPSHPDFKIPEFSEAGAPLSLKLTAKFNQHADMEELETYHLDRLEALSVSPPGNAFKEPHLAARHALRMMINNAEPLMRCRGYKDGHVVIAPPLSHMSIISGLAAYMATPPKTRCESQSNVMCIMPSTYILNV